MPGFLADVEELADTEAFKTCVIYAPWQRLHALVQDRLAFLETFDSAPSVLYKACDNMEVSWLHSDVAVLILVLVWRGTHQVRSSSLFHMSRSILLLERVPEG
jgi:hypothetical protein